MHLRIRCIDVASVAALGAALAASGVGACTKKDDAGKPAGIAAMPSGAQPPLPAAPPPAAPAAEAPPAGPPDPGASITGTIVLPSAQAKTKPKGTLFLV